MPENENQYELDENYEPLGIVDAADGSGTTWPEFIEQVNKMDEQVAALTEDRNSRFQRLTFNNYINNSSLASLDVSSASSSTCVPMFSFLDLEGNTVVAFSIDPRNGALSVYDSDYNKIRGI